MKRTNCYIATISVLISVCFDGINADSFEEAATNEFNKNYFEQKNLPQNIVLFKLSNDYPKVEPNSESYPWDSVSFKEQPEKYLHRVLNYVLEGNIDVDWRVHENQVRKWYHAPWMHYNRTRGRESVHGLTQERSSKAGELHSNQVDKFQNWAVGIYNAPGGYILGKVWSDPTNPNSRNVLFPIGTVAAKLLFTSAEVKQVPYLKNSKEWNADINRNGNLVTLKLLQFDVAVRDRRADDTTGWVFGTFVYHADEPGETVWKKLLPVGLHWGNDPNFTKDKYEAGEIPQEGWVNPKSKEKILDNLKNRKHFGLWGRMNGPVDNPKSACLACHARAMDLGENICNKPPFTPRSYKDETIKDFFKNRKPKESFDKSCNSLDYSLQLSDGIYHFRNWAKNFRMKTSQNTRTTNSQTEFKDDSPFIRGVIE